MGTLRENNPEVYYCWEAIKQRCNNPNARAYHNYGGRGITYCEEWEQFKPFCEWALANGWKKGLDIDRIDNDGNYTPDNCRWVTRRENINNRRKTINLTICDETKPLTMWAEEIGVDRAVIKRWIYEHGAEYAESRIAEALEHGYKPNDYSRDHPHFEVAHLETGLVFRSIRDAAAHFNMSAGSLSVALRKGGHTKKGTFVLTGVVS